MRRFPTWLKVTIPIAVVLLLLVATFLRVLFEQLPPGTQEQIADRFERQLKMLGELAATMPIDPCEELEVDDAIRMAEQIGAWQVRANSHGELLADPVILQAKIHSSCEGSAVSFEVKAWETSRPLWRPSITELPEEWPSTTLWYSGTRRVVRYEELGQGSKSARHRLQLWLDLDGLMAGS